MTATKSGLDRRRFLQLGAATTGLAIGASALGDEPSPSEGMRYRPLGGTGLQVSEVSFGSYGFSNPALLSAALDEGFNMICTSADYQNGRAEEAIGEAIAKVADRRDQLILLTGTKVRHGTSAATVLETIDQSLRRLGTDRIEVFKTHSIDSPDDLRLDELFEAFETAKKAGKVLHLGLSGHRGGMQDCLNTAIDDGRFEVFHTKYDFVSYPDQEAIIHRAATKGIGTIVFKTSAGNRQQEIKDLEAGGLSFTQATVKWALASPNVASVSVQITNFDQIREYAAAVRTRLARTEVEMLRRYADHVAHRYCRFCATCEAGCQHGVAVADIMRFAMYFRYYGREKDAMTNYAALPADRSAASCENCSAPCDRRCPFGRRVRSGLIEAHQMLRFARA